MVCGIASKNSLLLPWAGHSDVLRRYESRSVVQPTDCPMDEATDIADQKGTLSTIGKRSVCARQSARADQRLREHQDSAERARRLSKPQATMQPLVLSIPCALTMIATGTPSESSTARMHVGRLSLKPTKYAGQSNRVRPYLVYRRGWVPPGSPPKYCLSVLFTKACRAAADEWVSY